MARAKKTAAAVTTETPAAAPVVIVAFKGFDADLKCREFQFEVGKSYKHEGRVVACESGFHACEHPLNVFGYYPPATSRYCQVELSGKTARHGDDTKIAAAEITIKAELRLPQLIAAAIDYVFSRAKWIEGSLTEKDGEGVKSSRHGGAATASGTWGAATASGYQGAATASGYQGAATASGAGGAATASGDWGAATASGTRGAATASGRWGAATASGYQGKVRGKEGNALFLVERDTSGRILHAWAGIAGRDGIKPDAWYRLEDGKPVEVPEGEGE
jgi:hypothetical protein